MQPGISAEGLNQFDIQTVFDAPPPVSHREFRGLAATGSVGHPRRVPA
jgi:hypothetical protein